MLSHPLLQTTTIQIVSLVVDTILAILLIAVYVWIAKSEQEQAELQESVVKIQNKQTDILDSQTEIQKTTQLPTLRVDSIEPTHEEGAERPYHGSSFFTLAISNVGGGVATDLHLILDGECEETEVQPVETTHKLRPIANITHENQISTSEAYLDPGAKQIELQAAGSMKMSNSSSQSVFEMVTEEIAKEGGEILRFSMSLQYSDAFGETHTRQIAEYYLPLKGRTSIEDAFSNGLPSDAPKALDRTKSNRSRM